jgi:hypothetical protein
MTIRDHKKIFFSLIAVWFVVNILQSIFTEVISDEAYYFLYGKYLAWGYYDHPPMVALLIRISSLFFGGNLGIRFMTVLLQLGTLLIIWKILDVKEANPGQVTLFFIISSSICMFAAYGVFTTPDVPLLFFTALFLYSYRDFLGEQKWSTVIILSISMAGLVYSKYQAVLVIGFVVLSNIRLLKMYRFWLAGFVAVFLLIPHIYWQMANGYPSLKYHLLDRAEGFRLLYFLEYIPNQMAVFNPFILGAVTYIIIKFRPGDIFTRALYSLIIGFISFFWLTSFRGHVEPHWTVACSIPMIILLFNKANVSWLLKRFVHKYVLSSLVLIFLIRLFLVSNLPLVSYLGFDGKEEKYKFIESVSDDLPVVFVTSFQGPSLFTFFTGKEAFPISTLYTRQTQFDVWQFEQRYQNKKMFVAGIDLEGAKMFSKGRIKLTGFITDSLQTTNRVRIVYNEPEKLLRSGDSVTLSITLYNPCEYDIDFNHSRFPVQICAAIISGEETYIQPVSLSEPLGILQKGKPLRRTMKTVIPDLPSGSYQFGITLNTRLGPTLNSIFKKIKIVKYD